jgi:hypothetical protein
MFTDATLLLIARAAHASTQLQSCIMVVSRLLLLLQQPERNSIRAATVAKLLPHACTH